MSLKNTAERFFKRLIDIEPAKQFLTHNQKNVRFEVTGESPFIVSFSQDGIETMDDDGKITVDFGVEANEETYMEIFAGKISPAEAFQGRRLFFGGILYKDFPWLTRMMKIAQTGRLR